MEDEDFFEDWSDSFDDRDADDWEDFYGSAEPDE